MNPWLNRTLPDFTLPQLGGGRLSLSDLRGFITLINFWSVECAWSRRADVMLVYRALTWEPRGVRFVGVAANADETETAMEFEARRRHVSYPLVRDFDRHVADLYRAECTPHFFLLDRQGVARYIGAPDDATAEAREPRLLYLENAVLALLAGAVPDPAWTPAYGCDIVRQAGSIRSYPVSP